MAFTHKRSELKGLGAEAKPGTPNVLENLIQSGFGLYNRITMLKSAETARKHAEALAHAETQAKIAEAQARAKAAQITYVAPPPSRYPVQPVRAGAGMNMGTIAMLGGAGILAVVVATQMGGRKRR